MSEREIPTSGDDSTLPSVPARKPWAAPRVEEIEYVETEAWPLSSRFLDGDVVLKPNGC